MRASSQPVSFTEEISLKITETSVPLLLNTVYGYFTLCAILEVRKLTIATAIQMAHLIAAITDFQLKRDAS